MRDLVDISEALATGVYVLRRGGRVVWIGRAKLVAAKLYAHLRGGTFGSFQFDSVSVRRCRVDQLDEVYAATCAELAWAAPGVVVRFDSQAAPLRRRA